MDFFAKLAVMYRMISKQQLDEALALKREKAKQGMKSTLKQIFEEERILSPKKVQMLSQVIDGLKEERKNKRFGVIAVRNYYITEDDLDWALKIQREKYSGDLQKNIGEILVESGKMTQEQCNAVMLEQQNIIIEIPNLTVIADFAEEAEQSSAPKEEDSLEESSIASVITDRVDGQAQSEAFQSTCLTDYVVLRILEENLIAQLLVKKPIPPIFDVDVIKEFLADYGICHGIVDDARIEAFLNDPSLQSEPFTVAEGNPPIQGVDGSIQYFFDTDHLRAGKLDADGQIDYRDRGDIPRVTQGELLAEYIPAIPGEDGLDIMGNPIPAQAESSVFLKCDTGVLLSEDGRQAFATIDGQPIAKLGGIVGVYPELVIEGDVDFNTGHIAFDGNIVVKGTIRNDFRVKGTSIYAGGIEKAYIDALADVHVDGGVIGATIITQGLVKAIHIKNATISTLGNVLVEKEILDTTIKAGGICQVRSGNIISSKISARKGILAKDIGSETTAPNILRIGVDDCVVMEMEKIKAEVVLLSQRKKDQQKKMDDQIKEQIHSHIQIAELGEVQERIEGIKKMVMIKLKDYIKEGRKINVELVREIKRKLDQQELDADQNLKKYFDMQTPYLTRIFEVGQSIKELEHKIDSLDEEKKGVLTWLQEEPPKSYAKVFGTFHERTAIHGKHASTRLRRAYTHVQVREVRVRQKNGTLKWEMQIVRH